MQRIRWPKNFSVFSSSDSDSDGPTSAHRRARAAHLRIDTEKASPASSSYPSPVSPGSKSHAPVLGVYIFCAGDQVDLSSLQTPTTPSTHSSTPNLGVATVQQSDAIFSATPLPITKLIGVPLLMRRLLSKPSSSLPASPHFDNPLAAQLQIDPAGDQPARVQGVGTVLVTRADRQPLQKDLLESICAFHAQLLSIAHQQRGVSISEVVNTWATPEKFNAFCAKQPRNMSNSTTEPLGGSWMNL